MILLLIAVTAALAWAAFGHLAYVVAPGPLVREAVIRTAARTPWRRVRSLAMAGALVAAAALLWGWA